MNSYLSVVGQSTFKYLFLSMYTELHSSGLVTLKAEVILRTKSNPKIGNDLSCTPLNDDVTVYRALMSLHKFAHRTPLAFPAPLAPLQNLQENTEGDHESRGPLQCL